MNGGMLLRSMQVGPSRRPWARVQTSPSVWSFPEHGRTCPEDDDLSGRCSNASFGSTKRTWTKCGQRLRYEGHTELEAIVGTTAETLLEQGKALGLSEGRAEGRADTFMNLARIRFGDVPAARADEVRAADAATLDRWLEALIDADTLDEVFDIRRHH